MILLIHFLKYLGVAYSSKQNLPQHLKEVRSEASVYLEENGKVKEKKPHSIIRISS